MAVGGSGCRDALVGTLFLLWWGWRLGWPASEMALEVAVHVPFQTFALPSPQSHASRHQQTAQSLWPLPRSSFSPPPPPRPGPSSDDGPASERRAAHRLAPAQCAWFGARKRGHAHADDGPSPARHNLPRDPLAAASTVTVLRRHAKSDVPHRLLATASPSPPTARPSTSDFFRFALRCALASTAARPSADDAAARPWPSAAATRGSPTSHQTRNSSNVKRPEASSNSSEPHPGRRCSARAPAWRTSPAARRGRCTRRRPRAD